MKNRITLKKKLLLVMIPLIIGTLLIVSVIIYSAAQQSIQDKVAEYMEQYLERLSTSIDNKLETSIRMNAQLGVNVQLQEVLKKYEGAGNNDRQAYRQDITDVFSSLISVYDNIK